MTSMMASASGSFIDRKVFRARAYPAQAGETTDDDENDEIDEDVAGGYRIIQHEPDTSDADINADANEEDCDGEDGEDNDDDDKDEADDKLYALMKSV